MNKSALYTVIENGSKNYFYSSFAGTYHAPIIAIMGAETHLDNNKLLDKVADVFFLLQFNHLYDKDRNLNGESVFDEVDEEEMEALLSEFGQTATYDMHIILDIDSGTISYRHNDMCFGDGRADFSVSISEGICCYEETANEAANEGKFLPLVIEDKMMRKLTEYPEQALLSKSNAKLKLGELIKTPLMNSVYLVHDTADIGFVPVGGMSLGKISDEVRSEWADVLDADVTKIYMGAYGIYIELANVDPERLSEFQYAWDKEPGESLAPQINL